MSEPKNRKGNGRNERGQFVPGNPGGTGRPKLPAEVRAALEALTMEAVDTLAHVMRTGRPRERLLAAEAILDRRWGKPAQAVHHLGEDGGPVMVAMLTPEERRARIQELLARCDDLAASDERS